MDKYILEIEKISKLYNISGQQENYLSFRDSIKKAFSKSAKENFWALKDVSFNVEAGDSIGIIGKNGAGKSTLLKILSRITPPTEGRIISRGRIASLLEVGTGFHGELSGRENVFMNGSILGMKKQEIVKNFDAIVDFSGVEKFIDTPLKHYSSGMQLRLAFAVAAFLENEILIIDEVLAVGDSEFQKKCMGKMKDVTNSGRTVLFVSHDIDSVMNLCNKGAYLNQGVLQEFGEINSVIKRYSQVQDIYFKEWNQADAPGDNKIRLHKVSLIDKNLQGLKHIRIDQEIGVCLEYEILDNETDPSPNIHLYTHLGTYVLIAISGVSHMGKGKYRTIGWIPANTLNNIQYNLGISITTLKNVTVHLDIPDILNFEAFEDKSMRNHEFAGLVPGIVRPDFMFDSKKI